MPDSNSSHNPLGSLPINTLLPKFAIPSIVAYLVTSLYNIVDQIFIGQGVGYLGNAATNVAFPFTTVSTAIALMIENQNTRSGDYAKTADLLRPST